MNIHFISPLMAFRTLSLLRQQMHHFLFIFALKAKLERHTLRFIQAEQPGNKYDQLIGLNLMEMY